MTSLVICLAVIEYSESSFIFLVFLIFVDAFMPTGIDFWGCIWTELRDYFVYGSVV